MNQLNSTLIEGNLTRDAELKHTPSGAAVCIFSIASNRSYKKGDEWEKEVSFFDIEAWSKLAEACGILKKGRGVRVTGRLKQERWTDAEGQARSKVKVVAEHVEFMPERKAEAALDDRDLPASLDECLPEECPF